MTESNFNLVIEKEAKTMPRFVVPCKWRMCGSILVKADTKEEAIKKAKEPDMPLPDDSSYEDGSFVVFEEEVEELVKKGENCNDGTNDSGTRPARSVSLGRARRTGSFTAL